MGSRVSCLGAALHLLSRRQMTTRALTEKLQKKGYSPEEIQEAVDRLNEWNYLDDRSFAAGFIKNHREKHSKRYIFYKLSAAGIDPQTLDEALAEHYPDEMEEAGCLRAAQKLLPAEQNKWKRKLQKSALQDRDLSEGDFHDRDLSESDLHDRESFEDEWQEPWAGEIRAAVYRGLKEKLVRRGYEIRTVDAVLARLIRRDNY